MPGSRATPDNDLLTGPDSIPPGLGAGTWEWDIQASQVCWSAELKGIYGLREPESFEPAIEAFLQCVHPEDRARVMAVVSETLALRRQTHAQQFRILRPDGELRHILSRARLECDGNGKPVYLRGIDIDLTDGIAFPHSQHSRATAAMAVEAAQAGTWSWDSQTNQSEWDERYHQTYGFASSAKPSFNLWLAALHPEDRPGVLARLDAMSRSPGDDTWQMEFRILHPKSGLRWMQGIGHADRNGAGEIQRMVGLNLDITSRKLAEAAVQENDQRKTYLLKLEETLRMADSAEEQLLGACRILAEELDASRVGFADVALDAASLIVDQEWRKPGMPAGTGRYVIADYGLERFAPVLNGEAAICEDVLSDRRVSGPDMLARFADLGVRATLEVPLLRGGRLRAVLFIAGSKPRQWSAGHIELARQTLERTLHAVEWMRSESRLRASEQRYRELFNTIDQGFCIIEMLYDAAGKPRDYLFLEVNQLFEEQTGLVDAVGKTALQLVPGLEQWWLDVYGQVGLTGVSTRFEHGSAVMGRWFDVFASRVGGEESRKVAIVFNDISKRVQAEEALRAKTHQLESLLTNAPLGVAFFDRDHRYVQINQELAAINGIAPAEHIGRRLDDLLPGAAPSVIPLLDRTFATGEAVGNVEVAGETPREPGVERHWLTGFYPVFDNNGAIELTGTWVTEITELKRGEIALRTSESKLRLGMAIAGIGLGTIDYVAGTISLDARAADLFGLPANSPLLRSAVHARFHPDDAAVLVAQIEELLRPGGTGFLSADHRIIWPDGTIRWLSARKQIEFSPPESGLPQEPLSGLLAVRDITSRKTSEEQIRLLMGEVNHRAKNLLAVVQAVARQTAGNDDPKDFAEHFARRLAGLAASHDLLVRAAWSGVGLSDLLTSQLEHFSGLIGSRVILNGPPLQITPAAAQALGMAIHELATNAGKYGALSDDAGSVQITWTLDGSGFSLHWTESGGPPCRPPAHRGFGHTVMVNMVKHALEAEVTLAFPASGLVWTVTAAAERVLARPAIGE